MKVKELFQVTYGWTNTTILELTPDSTEEIFNGLMMELETGIKEENCENILFDEENEKILGLTVLEVEAVGDNKIEVTVIKEGDAIE